MLKLTGILGFMMLFLTTGMFAQRGIEDGSKYGQGEDSATCVRNLSLYRQYVRQSMFKDAWPFWKEVAFNCPLSSRNVFIDGPKIAGDYIEKATDEATKNSWVDTLILIYDLRTQHYPENKGFILGRQGVDVYKYMNAQMDYVEKAFRMLTESLELEREKSSAASMLALMNASVNLYQDGRLSRDQVVTTYSNIIDVYDLLMESKPDDQRLLGAKKLIDDTFLSSRVADCNTLDEMYGARFDENPNDPKLLKLMYRLYSGLDCRGSQYFYRSFEQLVNIDSSASQLYRFAELARDNGDYEKAASYFKKAINNQTDDKVKAGYYIKLSEVSFRSLGRLGAARSYALKSFEMDPSSAVPYMMIGAIYASAKCSDKEINKKAVFWLAVDYYNKAKQVDPSVAEECDKNIAVYRQYWPDKTEIFYNTLEIGASYLVDCGWINESTTIRSRD